MIRIHPDIRISFIDHRTVKGMPPVAVFIVRYFKAFAYYFAGRGKKIVRQIVTLHPNKPTS
jgi:hypothetical protein